MTKTIGISPKVANPALTGLVVGAALVIIGLAIGDDRLTTAGISLLVGAVGLGGVGYASDPGTVVRETPAASDKLNAGAFARHLR